MLVGASTVLFLLELFDRYGMTPNLLGWVLIFLICFPVYFLICTQLIRLEPVGAGEDICIYVDSELADFEADAKLQLKNQKTLDREKTDDWQCSKCLEQNGRAFEVCWNCGTDLVDG